MNRIFFGTAFPITEIPRPAYSTMGQGSKCNDWNNSPTLENRIVEILGTVWMVIVRELEWEDEPELG
jgi:hypothetical protein